MAKIHTVHREFEVHCVQGVAVELRHVVPTGWTVTEASDSFVVRGTLGEDWQDELWSVVRFVAYESFHAVEETLKTPTEVRYEMVSASASGNAFRIEFVLTAGARPGLPS
jgi:hypothetical protein